MATAVERWVRKQVVRPRYRPPAEHLALRAADGTALHAVRLAGPRHAVTSVVVVHGITNSSRTPRVHAFAHAVCRWAPVVVVDLRGHGSSAGRCTLGADEPLDVAAAVVAAQRHDPDLPVTVIGTSLGGFAALVAAARPDRFAPARLLGVVSVSAPANLDGDRPGAARMLQMASSSRGRALARGVFRTRIDPGWQPLVGDLTALLQHDADSFTVIAHDPDEPFFGPEHAEALFAAVPAPKEQWWLPGTGHGGDVLTADLAERIDGRVRKAAAP